MLTAWKYRPRQPGSRSVTFSLSTSTNDKVTLRHSAYQMNPKICMARSCLGLAEERLVPFEATRHIGYADDRPSAFHDVFSRRPQEGTTVFKQEGHCPVDGISAESPLQSTLHRSWRRRPQDGSCQH